MKKVEVFLTEERRLVLRQENGVEYFVEIYNGGGYYTDFMFYTAKELLQRKQKQEREQKKLRKKYEQNAVEEKTKRKWYQFYFKPTKTGLKISRMVRRVLKSGKRAAYPSLTLKNLEKIHGFFTNSQRKEK